MSGAKRTKKLRTAAIPPRSKCNQDAADKRFQFWNDQAASRKHFFV